MGQEDGAELTNEGLLQSQLLSHFLHEEGVDQIISSPSRRARESIARFASDHNLVVGIDERLRERRLSSESLDNWVVCLKNTFQDRDLRYTGGETSREAASRAYGVVQEVISSGYQTTALVTHGNLMTLILGTFDRGIGFDDWARLSNPDVYRVRTDGLNHDVKRIWNRG